MDLIKGLASGFFHTWECGDSAHRTKVFKNSYKEYVDKGMFIRDIQDAPRDARYKIDHYYREDTKEVYTVAYPYLGFFEEVLEKLNIDESFDWKKVLVDLKGEYSYGDFAIGFKDFDSKEIYPNVLSNRTLSVFYFKYKGEVNCLDFRCSKEVVNYSDNFYKERKDRPSVYHEVDNLLHNIGYFMQYKNLL